MPGKVTSFVLASLALSSALSGSAQESHGWGQNEGIPAIRDYYPASDGSFVSAAQGKLPAARIRKRGDVVELVR